MAVSSSQSPPSRDVDNIQSLLECPVCFETFRTPKCLTCGHSVCADCCQNLGLGNSIACPVCRRVTIVTVLGLATNFVLEDIVQYYQEREEQKGYRSMERQPKTGIVHPPRQFRQLYQTSEYSNQSEDPPASPALNIRGGYSGPHPRRSNIDDQYDHSGVYLTNIPLSTRDEDVGNLLSNYGKLVGEVRVIRKDGNTIAFAFANFESTKSVRNLLRMQTLMLGNAEISVQPLRKGGWAASRGGYRGGMDPRGRGGRGRGRGRGGRGSSGFVEEEEVRRRGAGGWYGGGVA